MVHDFFRAGFVDVIPVGRKAIVRLRLQRHQKLQFWLLGHRIHEVIRGNENLVDGTAHVGVEHDLYRTDELLHVRLITKPTHLSGNRPTNPLEELRGLPPDGAELELHLLGLPALDLLKKHAEQI